MSTQLTIDLLLMHNDSPLSHEAAIDSRYKS